MQCDLSLMRSRYQWAQLSDAQSYISCWSTHSVVLYVTWMVCSTLPCHLKAPILLQQFNKRLESFAQAIPSLFYWQISKKTYSFLVLNVLTKISETENSSLFMSRILDNGKMRVDKQTKTGVWEDLRWNSWTAYFLKVSRHKLKSSQMSFLPSFFHSTRCYSWILGCSDFYFFSHFEV